MHFLTNTCRVSLLLLTSPASVIAATLSLALKTAVIQSIQVTLVSVIQQRLHIDHVDHRPHSPNTKITSSLSIAIYA